MEALIFNFGAGGLTTGLWTGTGLLIFMMFCLSYGLVFGFVYRESDWTNDLKRSPRST